MGEPPTREHLLKGKAQYGGPPCFVKRQKMFELSKAVDIKWLVQGGLLY